MKYPPLKQMFWILSQSLFAFNFANNFQSTITAYNSLE